MNPFKIIGGLLILFGVVFRAISIAYFNLRAKSVPGNPKAQRRLASSRQRALIIDYLFIAIGLYTLLVH